MVIIADGLQIENERRVSIDAQGGSGEKRGFKTVPRPIAYRPSRRSAGFAVVFLVVRKVSQVLLDFPGSGELAKELCFGRAKHQGI
jgi:hypothetical protein